jgi:branched-chain amino acid aminotransferase
MPNDDIIWWNGSLVPWDSARVHVTSETALRGLNVFEGLRAYWRPNERAYAVIGLDAHLDRLAESARLTLIPAPDIRQRMLSGIDALLQRISDPSDLYMRPTLYVDRGGYEHDPQRIIVGEFISWRREPARTSRSLKCGISSWTRVPPSCLPSKAKIGATYTAFRLARLEMTTRGLDEAILLNEHGHITETAGGSIFIARSGVLATPSLSSGILSSITRRIVIDVLCPRLGYEVQERSLTPDDLRAADGAFIVGTLDEISNISSVDEHEFGKDGSANGVCCELAILFRSFCEGSQFQGTKWASIISLRGAHS